MSLIKCPECNEKISSTVNQCIHCGSKITVCPECDKIFIEELDKCPECGYVFEKTNKLENSKRGSETSVFSTAKEAVEKWKSENSLRNIYFTKIINIVLSGLKWLFCILFFFEFLNWFTPVVQTTNLTNSLEKLDLLLSANLSAEETLKNINTFLALFVFFDVLHNFWSTSKEAIYTLDFSSWARKRAINLEEIIRKNLSIDFSKNAREEIVKQSKALQLTLNAEVYDKNIIAKNNYINYHAISNVTDLIYTILFAIFFSSNIENYMNKVLSQGEFVKLEWSLIVNWWLIILIVLFMIIEPIYIKSIEKKLESSRKQWINKNMPEYDFKYEKYIVDPDSIE